MRTTRSAVLALGVAILPAAVAAQPVTELDAIVLSGGLTPIAEGEYGRANTVLTAETIAARGYVSVEQALRAVPGFNVALGGINEFRVRGSEANHTLILVDGVEVQSPGDGFYELGNLRVEDVARIEVLRGPQSAIYGASAAAGVLNIITKGADGPGASGTVSAEIGTDRSYSVSLSAGVRGARGRLSFSASQSESDGYDISNDATGVKDPRDNRTLNLKGEADVTDWLTAGFTLRRVERTEGYDDTQFAGPFTREDYVVEGLNFRDDDELSASVYARARHMGGRLEHALTFSRFDGDRLFRTAFGDFGNSFGRDKAAYRLSYGFDGTVEQADHLLTGLLEWEDEFIDTGVRSERQMSSLAGEYRARLGNGLNLQVGLRRDFNEEFRDATSWNIGASYTLPDGLTRLHASAGRGVVNPTLFEQFGFFGTFVGNPDLVPEKNTAFDFGVERTILGGRGTVDVTVFSGRITDRISTEATATGTTAVNLSGESTQAGVEVSADFAATDTLTVGLSYTYTDAEDPDGTPSIRRPEHALDLNLDWSVLDGRGNVNLGVSYAAGATFLDFSSFGKVPGDDHVVVSLGGSYDLTDRAQVYARIDNLLDENYEEQWGYVARGRSAVIGLRSSF